MEDIDEEQEQPRRAIYQDLSDPQEFLANLKEKMESKLINYELLPKVTNAESPPDCFVWTFGDSGIARREYRAWLGLAVDADVPYRFDMPGEPNYCHDCTATHKAAAVRAGRCGFPNTTFEVARYLGEKETVGVSRSVSVKPDNYYQFRDMIVPREALPEFILNEMEKSG